MLNHLTLGGFKHGPFAWPSGHLNLRLHYVMFNLCPKAKAKSLMNIWDKNISSELNKLIFDITFYK